MNTTDALGPPILFPFLSHFGWLFLLRRGFCLLQTARALGPKGTSILSCPLSDETYVQFNRRYPGRPLFTSSSGIFDRGGGFYSTPIDLVKHSLSTAFTLGLEPAIQSPDPRGAFNTREITIHGIPFLLQNTLHISCDLEGRGLFYSATRNNLSSTATHPRASQRM
ncbi:uncharacterized protein EI90DRAFT_3072650 [Cantharellus anzutake]|uniref:uncharacterized protein n=1 Tax=Cantharellus anzutake TaxID=1750568 RepID=UPI001908399E|nr:uncharacterized protein EI90DRAFT_3072650 [Cantharellus anzutake]KAF8325380.1 hypothetical protein EI90DRAFT_3072650 [Cantharellus anzutake]